jgi:hypothetical protein
MSDVLCLGPSRLKGSPNSSTLNEGKLLVKNISVTGSDELIDVIFAS